MSDFSVKFSLGPVTYVPLYREASPAAAEKRAATASHDRRSWRFWPTARHYDELAAIVEMQARTIGALHDRLNRLEQQASGHGERLSRGDAVLHWLAAAVERFEEAWFGAPPLPPEPAPPMLKLVAKDGKVLPDKTEPDDRQEA